MDAWFRCGTNIEGIRKFLPQIEEDMKVISGGISEGKTWRHIYRELCLSSELTI